MYPGATYHVRSRANGKGVIFESEVDRQDLKQGRKSDSGKLELASRLRRETPLTLPWIAERLQMGTWKSLNGKLYRWRKNEKGAK